MPIKKPIKPTDGRLKKNRAKKATSKAAASKTMKKTKAAARKRKT
jgi:hypothetical protein